MSDPLETLVERALLETPLRRAPPTLESRVLRELSRRAALPWWRHSFERWPRLARAGFTVTCGSIVAAVLAATWPLTWGGALAGTGAWAAGSSLGLPWARSALALVEVARELNAALVRAVPPEWLYGAMAAGVISYVALFGLGAAAYRTLYLNSSSAGDRS